jgi:hypothetical protein
MKTIKDIEKDIYDILTKIKQIQEDIKKLKGKDPLKEYEIELDKILTELVLKTGITEYEVRSKSREREITEVRQMYFKRAREITNITLYKIGKFIGRDHATVFYGIKQVNTIPELIKKYNRYFGEEQQTETEDKKYLVPGGKKFGIIETSKPFKSIYSNIEDSSNKPVMDYQALIK